MSNEQSQIPQHDQPNWYGQASFIPGEQVDFRKSNLESVAILQARQAIAAAISTAPSGSLEVKTLEISHTPETQFEKVRRTARTLAYMRRAYQDNTFNLEADDAITIEMFDAPKPDVSNATKDDMDLAA